MSVSIFTDLCKQERAKKREQGVKGRQADIDNEVVARTLAARLVSVYWLAFGCKESKLRRLAVLLPEWQAYISLALRLCIATSVVLSVHLLLKRRSIMSSYNRKSQHTTRHPTDSSTFA